MRLYYNLFSALKIRRPFYVTTPIFYVNAAPHIGHLYSALVADTVQRFEKLVDPNVKVAFSTGTDEHGTKIQQAASNLNQPLHEYCMKISKEYRDLFDNFNVDYTEFVRTTEERHKTAVQHFWRDLQSRDQVYKSKYAGWYSVNDETFVPETQTKEDIRNGQKVRVSEESGHVVEWTEETNYMFRMSAYKTHLQEWLDQDGVVSPVRFQRQLQQMLQSEVYFPDISVSRPSSRVHWAVRVPDDDSQSIYVWLDALINYLTAVGYPSEDLMRDRGRLWPADLHVVGKDILKFHAIYWPAFLMAIKFHPPRRILCHGHWTVDGVKMSKSLGNVVSPDTAVGPEPLRYMMLREHTMHSDANFSSTKLIHIVNSELADTLGNLVSRCCGQALNPRQEVPRLHRELLDRCDSKALLNELERLPDTCRIYYSTYQFYKVADNVIKVLHLANSFFETNKPWELKKDQATQPHLDTVLHITMETLRICAIILQPMIPGFSKKILDKLNTSDKERKWTDCERMSWITEDEAIGAKKIESGKFVLFQRVYVDKTQKSVKAG